MPITRARTSPPSGLRSTAAEASVRAMTTASPAAHNDRSRDRMERIPPSPWLLALPFDAPIERVDVFLAQPRRVGYVHGLIRALAHCLHRDIQAILADEARNRLGALARELHVEFGRAAHVGVPDQNEPRRALLLEHVDQLARGFFADAGQVRLAVFERDRHRNCARQNAAHRA